MIQAARNLLISAIAMFVAILVAALGQGALENGAPSFSDQIIGTTNIGTYALLVMLGCLFFVEGALVTRWLRTSVPLVWLLLPPVALYAFALAQPYPYRCVPGDGGGCWALQSPFAVSIAALVLGYIVRGKSLSTRGASV